MGPRASDLDDGDYTDVVRDDAADTDTEVDEVAVARDQIEHTRAEMGQTIEALKEKLNPDTLKEQAKEVTSDVMDKAKETVHHMTADVVQQAKESVHHATEAVHDATIGRAQRVMGSAVDTAKDAGTTIVDVIRENPLPAVLSGIGLAWLFLNARNANRERSVFRGYQDVSRYGYGYGYETGQPAYQDSQPQQGTDGGAIDQVKERVGEVAGQVKERAGEVAGQVQDRVSDVADQARDMAGQARERAGEVAGQVRERAGEVAGQVRDAGSSIVDMIRANPVPAVLSAASLAWFFLSARGEDRDRSIYRGDGDTYRYDYQPGYQEYGSQQGTGGRAVDQVRERAGEVAGQVKERAGEVAGQVQSRVSDVADQARDMAGQARERAGEVAGQVRERAGEVAGQVREGVSHLSTRAQDQAQRAADGFQRTLQDNPLATAAAALAVGAIVGLAIPETQHENRWMGPTRDQLMDRAQQTAQGLKDKAQVVAQEAINTVKHEAQEQGLMADIKDVAREAVATVKQTAQDQGLTGQQPGTA